jgi:hypothetical protein
VCRDAFYSIGIEPPRDAIEARDGDMRATIRALIVTNSHLSADNDRLRECTSVGYIRGRRNLISG